MEGPQGEPNTPSSSRTASLRNRLLIHTISAAPRRWKWDAQTGDTWEGRRELKVAAQLQRGVGGDLTVCVGNEDIENFFVIKELSTTALELHTQHIFLKTITQSQWRNHLDKESLNIIIQDSSTSLPRERPQHHLIRSVPILYVHFWYNIHVSALIISWFRY